MKRRAAPNRQSAGVSLFPFLAVLLCTMGALIVVLVVIARQARLQGAANAAAAPDDELAAKQAELEWRISQLRQSRDATQKTLADKQTELSHIEEHARRLRRELEELASARERLSQMAAGDERDKAKLKSELDRLQHRVAGLRGELGKLTEKAREGRQSYAVIPYRGPNETYRRPIYIECRATGVVLQPSGLTLTEQDFAIDGGLGNPLASAVRAAREYYLRNSLKGEGETGSAYPLMIVRPDGVLAYLAARQVLESLGPDFGYELVAQDWQIEFPPTDPMLLLAMKQAISEGRMRQAYLASAAPGLFFNRRQISFRTAHGGAGGAPTLSGGLRKYRSAFASGRPAGVAGGMNGAGRNAAGRPGAADNPYLDALASDDTGQNEGSGFRGQRSGSSGVGSGGAWAGNEQANGEYAGGIGIGSRNAGEPLAANGPRVGVGGPGVSNQRPGLGGGASGNAGHDASSRLPAASAGQFAAAQGYGGNGIARSPTGPGTTAQGTTPGAARSGAEFASAAGTKAGGLPGIKPGGLPGTKPGGLAGTKPGGLAGTKPGELPGTQGAGAGKNAAGNGSGDGTRSGTDQAATAGSRAMATAQRTGSPAGAATASASDDNGTSTGQKTNNGAARSAGGRYAASGPATGASDAEGGSSGARGGTSGSGASTAGAGRLASTSRSGPRGSPSGGGSSGGSTASGGASGAGASSGSTAMGGGSMGSSTMPPGQMSMPMPMIAMGAQPPAAQNSSGGRGTKRERNWANPDASTSNVPVERRIQIVCDAEHLTIMPESRGARGMKVIKFGSHTDDSLDELVSTVWDRIDSWGTAGRGMYWRPKLVMMIEPGGQRRYTELQSLMADSGFDVHGRPRTMKPRR